MLNKEIADIVDLLSAKGLFNKDNSKLEEAKRLINEVERKYSPADLKKVNFIDIKSRYNQCKEIKNTIYAAAKKKLEEKEEKLPWWEGHISPEWSVKETLYLGGAGVITVTLRKTQFLETRTDDFLLLDDKLTEVEFDDGGKPISSHDEILEANDKNIPEEIAKITDLLSDEKWEFEKANEIIKNVQTKYQSTISFKNNFELNLLKNKAEQQEKKMKEHIDQSFERHRKEMSAEIKQHKKDISEQIDQQGEKYQESLKKVKEILEGRLERIKQQGEKHQNHLKEIINTLRKMEVEQVEQTKRLEDIKKQAVELQRAVNQANTNLVNIHNEQIKQTRDLQELHKEAVTLQKSVNQANTNLTNVGNEQLKQAKELVKIYEQAVKLENSTNQANINLVNIHTEQLKQANRLVEIYEQTAALQKLANETNMKLEKVKAEQITQTQNLERLYERAADLQRLANQANVNLEKVKTQLVEEDKKLSQLNEKTNQNKTAIDESNKQLGLLKQAAQKLQKVADQANENLKEVMQKQDVEVKKLDEINGRTQALQKSASQTNENLQHVMQKQDVEVKKLDEINGRTQVLQKSTSQTNENLQQVMQKQDIEVKKLDEINGRAQALQKSADHTNKKLEEVVQKQDVEIKKLDEVNGRAQALQKSTQQVSEDLKEIKQVQKREEATLSKINTNYIKSIEQSLQVDSSSLDRSAYSDEINSIFSWYSNSPTLLEAFQKLSGHFQVKKERHDQLLDQIIKECKVKCDDGDIETLKDLQEQISEMRSENSKTNTKDIERMKAFVMNAIEIESQLNAIEKKLLEDAKKTRDKSNKYEPCKEIVEMKSVGNEQLDKISSYTKKYEEEKDRNTKLAIEALNDQIKYIFSLADKNNKIAPLIKKSLENAIERRRRLLVKEEQQKLNRQLWDSYSFEEALTEYQSAWYEETFGDEDSARNKFTKTKALLRDINKASPSDVNNNNEHLKKYLAHEKIVVLKIEGDKFFTEACGLILEVSKGNSVNPLIPYERANEKFQYALEKYKLAHEISKQYNDDSFTKKIKKITEVIENVNERKAQVKNEQYEPRFFPSKNPSSDIFGDRSTEQKDKNFTLRNTHTN